MERGSAGRIPENQVHLGQVEESRRAVNKCSGLRASGSAEQGGIICVQSSTTPHLPLPLSLSLSLPLPLSAHLLPQFPISATTSPHPNTSPREG
ncbi:uncharacterized protein SEPMUDRAFT_150922 [Sphaerulina musiva SO2202]|uniref:Uncharacterized protein n=1 Tax=Sphaerulina musiva (strain SO2202) TaxID=692275 RepID=M3AUM5_SPHMS|nr:uncharacterized protein SEPMUDRAFT_150922 [Sphaerulina musiva SO2202]EMF09776.1 hypothetical protein SEPMUDRAFT_150922 [Sphaerulina musiva SO2202]